MNLNSTELFVSLMMLLLVLMIFSLFKENADAEVIRPFLTEQYVLAGKDITLSCNYSGYVQNLQWYRQYPRSKPENIIFHTEGNHQSESKLRLYAVADKGIKLMNLSISSTKLEDSALYYCALEPT
ncbi:hypothetical protein cypCar_00002416, partial [Cyprinus carpio]